MSNTFVNNEENRLKLGFGEETTKFLVEAEKACVVIVLHDNEFIKENLDLKSEPGKVTIVEFHGTENEKSTVDSVDAQHKNLGWAGGGYNFIIHKDGTIHLLRPLEYKGAHTKLSGNYLQEEIMERVDKLVEAGFSKEYINGNWDEIFPNKCEDKTKRQGEKDNYLLASEPNDGTIGISNVGCFIEKGEVETGNKVIKNGVEVDEVIRFSENNSSKKTVEDAIKLGLKEESLIGNDGKYMSNCEIIKNVWDYSDQNKIKYTPFAERKGLTTEQKESSAVLLALTTTIYGLDIQKNVKEHSDYNDGKQCPGHYCDTEEIKNMAAEIRDIEVEGHIYLKKELD